MGDVRARIFSSFDFKKAQGQGEDWAGAREVTTGLVSLTTAGGRKPGLDGTNGIIRGRVVNDAADDAADCLR